NSLAHHASPDVLGHAKTGGAHIDHHASTAEALANQQKIAAAEARAHLAEEAANKAKEAELAAEAKAKLAEETLATKTRLAEEAAKAQTQVEKIVPPEAETGNMISNPLKNYFKSHDSLLGKDYLKPKGIIHTDTIRPEQGAPEITINNPILSQPQVYHEPYTPGYRGDISPTRGIYNSGDVPVDARPNGFTHIVPMTNREVFEKAHLVNTQRVNEALIHQNSSEHLDQNHIGPNHVEGPKILDIKKNPLYIEHGKDIRKILDHRNLAIDDAGHDTIHGMTYSGWNHASDYLFEQKKLGFQSFDHYEKEAQMQRLFGIGEKHVKFIQEANENRQVVDMSYYRDIPKWGDIDKVPAKYFFAFMKDGGIDTSKVPSHDLDILVKSGVVKDTLAGGKHSYSWSGSHELERLTKTFKKIDPLNAKPVGDESMDSFIGRVTKKLHETKDGTLFGLKNGKISAEHVPTGTPRGAGYTPGQVYPRGFATGAGSGPVPMTNGGWYGEYNANFGVASQVRSAFIRGALRSIGGGY
ncbi:MAG: hypothetical protein WCK91_02630, partial [bacterium]